MLVFGTRWSDTLVVEIHIHIIRVHIVTSGYIIIINSHKQSYIIY